MSKTHLFAKVVKSSGNENSWRKGRRARSEKLSGRVTVLNRTFEISKLRRVLVIRVKIASHRVTLTPCPRLEGKGTDAGRRYRGERSES